MPSAAVGVVASLVGATLVPGAPGVLVPVVGETTVATLAEAALVTVS